MNFLNIALLGGASALLAPLIIHLLNRARFKSVDWGAMQLLEAALEVNSRRPQWEAILLLMMRCLIPVLLAFCLARPVLTAFQLPGAQGEKAIAYLLDDSLSMNAKQASGESCFAVARQQILDLTKTYAGAESTILVIGGLTDNPLEGSTFDPIRMRDALLDRNANAGALRVEESIEKGMQAVARMSGVSRHLVLASDFRAADWRNMSEQSLTQIRDKLAENGSVQLSLLNVSRDGAEVPENLSVEIAGIDYVGNLDAYALTDEPIQLIANVRNFGSKAVQDVVVEFTADQQNLAKQNISLEPNGIEQVVFGCEFSEEGWHTLEVHVNDSVGISQDDSAYQVLQIGAPQRVLVISDNGKATSQTTADDKTFNERVDYLRIALMPFLASDSRKNRYIVETITSKKFALTKKVDAPDAIVLSGVARLGAAQTKQLTEFIRSGGGLVVFADQELDARWYHEQLSGSEPVLPFHFGDEQSPNAPIGLMRETIQDAKLSLFNSSLAGDLGNVQVNRWRPLEPIPLDEAAGQSSNPTSVILRLGDGSPFLASRKVGQGTVIQCAISCSSNWSNLALQPVFVPLIGQIISATQRGSSESNIEVGDALTFDVDLSSENDQDRLRIVRAGSPELSFDLRPSEEVGPDVSRATNLEQGTMTFPRTRVPGLYQIEGVELDESNPSAPVVSPAVFAIRRPLAESDLRPLPARELDAIAESLGATVVRDAKDLQATSERHEHGQEIWGWVLVALLILLFMEQLLSRHLSGGPQ